VAKKCYIFLDIGFMFDTILTHWAGGGPGPGLENPKKLTLGISATLRQGKRMAQNPPSLKATAGGAQDMTQQGKGRGDIP
jgi:hypothetical protein